MKRRTPWKSSWEKVARCGMCNNLDHKNFSCNTGYEVKGPLITHEHDCRGYNYLPNPHFIPQEGWMIAFFSEPVKQFPECKECAHLFQRRCDGIQWYPWKHPNGKCEFFRHKNLICKNAIPCFQYSQSIRNNYCKLPPHLRDGDQRQGWKWKCPRAHCKDIEGMKCYKPKGDVPE